MAITKWKSSPRWPSPLLYLMRKSMNSQTQSFTSTRLTKIQYKQARIRPTEQISENQDLTILGFLWICTFSSSQLCASFWGKSFSKAFSSHRALTFSSEQASQGFLLFLKPKAFHLNLYPLALFMSFIPLQHSCPSRNFWNRELPNLESRARREENQAKHEVCTKSHFQLHKIILGSPISRLRTN